MKKKKPTIDDLIEEGKLKKAKDIPVPEPKIEVIEMNVMEGLQEMEQDQENGKRLRLFCERFKCPIEDVFVFLMENYRKKPKTANIEAVGSKKAIIQDFTKENSVGKPYNPFKNPLFSSKINKQAK